jgi:hypothetical protein
MLLHPHSLAVANPTLTPNTVDLRNRATSVRNRATSEGGVGVFAECGTGGFGDEVSAAGSPMPPLVKRSRGRQPFGDPVAHSVKTPAPPLSQQY